MAQIINREANTGPDAHAESSAAHRISQACSACRRKKVGVESGAICQRNVLILVTDQVRRTAALPYLQVARSIL
jgi:hypothetical protein